MHIFIDESGTFAIPKNGGHGISLVGALIIPDSRRDELFRRYQRVRRGLRLEDGEVKGRLQDERGVARVVDLLVKNGALYEVTVVDMGEHTEAELLYHKRRQGEGLTATLTDQHHPNLRREVWRLRERLEHMPSQLYVQSVATFRLLGRVFQHGTLYFSQRIPSELGRFHWIIDAKDRTRTTNWEEWWSVVMLPALQSRSLTEPLSICAQGDYSHFERFNALATDEDIKLFGLAPDRKVTLIRPIMTESFRFSADAEPGLELVDVVANATRRAMRGKLSFDGWRDIPRLMVHRRQHYIQLICLHNRPSQADGRPYREVLRQFQGRGHDMIAPRFRTPSRGYQRP